MGLMKIKNNVDNYSSAKHISSIDNIFCDNANNYLVLERKKQYEEMLKKAAKDEEFLRRTTKCDKDFAFIDSEE